MKINGAGWSGVGVALAVIIVAIAISLKIIPQIGRLVGLPSTAIEKTADALKSWGQNKINVVIQSDRLEVKPIAELAFSRTRVRSIINYQTTVFGSTKRIIAHQAFDIRIGWDIRDDVVFRVSPDEKIVHVMASPPRILTTTHVEDAPVPLLWDDGLVNKLTPEDAFELQRQLEASAKVSADVLEGKKLARDLFEIYFRGIFKIQGMNVVFDYKKG
jgi:hypothetical protein